MVNYTKSIAQCCRIISQGGVIICPSEGVYGLSCLIDNQAAIKRLLALKQRSQDKGFISVAAHLDQLSTYLDLSKLDAEVIELLDLNWPGPVTFILPQIMTLNELIQGQQQGLAVRISAFEPLRELCIGCQSALISTSANLSGQAASADLTKIAPCLLEQVDAVLDLPCGGLCGPSTIYDCLHKKILRGGSNFVAKA